MSSFQLPQAHELTSPDNLILAVSLTCALLFWINVRNPPSLPRTAAKTASTALLSCLSAARRGPTLLSLALALGATGDAFLAWSDGDAAFLGGLSSFLAAHVLYIKLFVEVGGDTSLLLAETWRTSLAVGMGLVAPGINVLLMPKISGKLRGPVAAYSAAIFLMFMSVLTVSNRQVVTGALLFTTSDVILASDRFLLSPQSAHRPWMQYAVWGLYYSGQLLIALGLAE